jgi:4-hydroxy-tetrahydrodipicolinate synthase
LDAPALERLIEHVIEGGVSGVFLLGTTGEFTSLGHEMRQEIVRRACAHVNRRVPVLVCISDTSVSETLRLADTAVESGADAVVLAAPYYFQHSQDDLLRYLERLTQVLTLPLFLYNIPPLTRNSFEPETVRRAADLPGIVGLKDSTGDPQYLRATMEVLRDRPGFSVLIGPEEMLVDAMSLGAHGGVCGGSNLNPKLFVSLYQAIVEKDQQRIAKLHAEVVRMGQALYRVGFPGSNYLRGIKAALALAGLCHPEPAPPFFPFSQEEYAKVAEGYRSLNL